MKSPKQTKIEPDRTHRLIPYRYGDRGRPILNLLAQDDDDLLSDLTELEGATNDRLLGESGRLPGVSAIELVSGFRLAHIVNASFTHPHPLGGRFNRGGRGAWFQLRGSMKGDLRGDPDLASCLDPNSYADSQTLGVKLLTRGSAGIVYPSVRHKDGVCIACCRPPLVLNVQEGPRVTFTFVEYELTAVVR
jgi:hypothetical protein